MWYAIFVRDIREEPERDRTCKLARVCAMCLLFIHNHNHTHLVYTDSEDSLLWKSIISGSSSGVIGRISIALPFFDTNLCSYWLGYGRMAGWIIFAVDEWSMTRASNAMSASLDASSGLISTSDIYGHCSITRWLKLTMSFSRLGMSTDLLPRTPLSAVYILVFFIMRWARFELRGGSANDRSLYTCKKYEIRV